MPLLPGHGCLFHVRGVCFYPEAASPGHDPAYRCGQLLRLTARWDDFLDRAEAFGLSEELAGRIWNARANEVLYSRRHCPAFCPSESDEALDAEGEALGCPYLLRGTCLPALPRCEGICEHYRARNGEFFNGREDGGKRSDS